MFVDRVIVKSVFTSNLSKAAQTYSNEYDITHQSDCVMIPMRKSTLILLFLIFSKRKWPLTNTARNCFELKQPIQHDFMCVYRLHCTLWHLEALTINTYARRNKVSMHTWENKWAIQARIADDDASFCIFSVAFVCVNYIFVHPRRHIVKLIGKVYFQKYHLVLGD